MLFPPFFSFLGNFFDIENGEDNEPIEVVRLIPTNVSDNCGNNHPSHISLKCSGHHDVKQNQIESICTTLVPEIPPCNDINSGRHRRYNIRGDTLSNQRPIVKQVYLI